MGPQRFVAVIAVVGVLAGCAAVWGKPYKVEFASSSSITINFDPGLTDMGEVQNVAQVHCAQFGKDAIPQLSQDSSPQSLVVCNDSPTPGHIIWTNSANTRTQNEVPPKGCIGVSGVTWLQANTASDHPNWVGHINR